MLSKLAATFLPRQLRHQLTWLSSLVLLITIAVYAGYSADEQAQFAQKRAELAVVALAKNIAVTSADAIILKNFAEMESLLVRMVGQPNIVGVLITDEQGRLLSHVVKKMGGKPEVRFGSRTIDTPAAANAATRIDYSKPASGWRYHLGLGDPGRMVVRQPIFSGTLLGWVVVDFDLAFTAEIRKHIWSDSLATGAIALIANLLLLLLFLKRPMGVLQTATNFAARLDESRGAQLPVFHGTSEIESLTTALNRVSTRLFSQSTDLNNQQFALLAQTAALTAEITEHRKTENALRDSEDNFRVMVEAQPECVKIVDVEGSLVEMNAAGLAIIEADSLQQVQGLSVVGLVAASQREAYRAFEANVLAGKSAAMEFEIIGLKGTHRWMESRAVPLPNQPDAHPKMLAITRDITERKKSEEAIRQLNTELNQFKNTLDQTLEAVYIFDPESLCFTYVNEGAKRQTGYSQTELMKMTPVDFNKPVVTVEKFKQLVQPLITGVQTSFTFQSVHRHKDGHEIPVEIFLQLIRLAGQEPRFVAMATDISERKQAQKEILQLNAELEERVLQRTAQLQTANQDLEAFSYSVSHDLRSPLNTIDGFSSLLVKEMGVSAATERGKHYLARIRSGVVQMGGLIDALLALAQVSRTSLRRESVDLSALAETVLNAYREREPDRAVQLAIQPGLVVQGDPGLLRQVLDNLLGNAWKYSSKQPQTHIIFRRESGPDGVAVYMVQDHGAGFDMAYSDKLFGVFQRLHTASEFEGTGIGLATVHKIITRHGGRIWAESAPGQGATFYFTLEA